MAEYQIKKNLLLWRGSGMYWWQGQLDRKELLFLSHAYLPEDTGRDGAVAMLARSSPPITRLTDCASKTTFDFSLSTLHRLARITGKRFWFTLSQKPRHAPALAFDSDPTDNWQAPPYPVWISFEPTTISQTDLVLYRSDEEVITTRTSLHFEKLVKFQNPSFAA
jgi:hypothetical protein